MNSENIYLNWGTLSKTWPAVMQAQIQHQLDYEVNPTISLFEGWDRLWKLQNKVSHFFGAEAQDFYFRPNVTLAMNDFIMGVDLPAVELSLIRQDTFTRGVKPARSVL